MPLYLRHQRVLAKLCIVITVPFVAMVIAASADASLGGATIMESPNPVDGRKIGLNAVSCPTALSCMAVGAFQTTRGISRTLAMKMVNQTWTLESTPNTSASENNHLIAVDCVNETFCMAVGMPDYVEGFLAMVWNGSAWSIVPGPTFSVTSSATLASVSCVSVSMCMAVGTLNIGGPIGKTPLIMRWDGSLWSQLTGPSLPSDRSNTLNAVSCSSVSNCMAVGQHRKPRLNGRDSGTLVITWDGSSWSNIDAPLNSTLDWVELGSVDCASQDSCVAVGNYRSDTGPIDGPILPLIIRWNGSTWTRETVPDVRGSTETILNSVSCVSSIACTVTGSKFSGAHVPWVIAMAEERLTEISVPKVSGSQGYARLYAVSCANVSHCVAVGSSEIADEQFKTTVVLLGSFVAPASNKSTTRTMSSAVKKSISQSSLVRAAALVVPKGARVTIGVSAKYKKVCKVVGSTVRTVGKGSCLVQVVVTTKSKKRTSNIVTIKVR